MISVGMVIGGPECKFMDKYVRNFLMFCKEKRHADFSGNAEVNIVFHLPGSVSKPDYVGLRTGKFSKKEKKLMVQLAVESEIINSSVNEVVVRYIYDVADEAIGIAKGFFDKKNVIYNLEKDRLLLDEWYVANGGSCSVPL